MLTSTQARNIQLCYTRLCSGARFFDIVDPQLFAREGVINVLHVYWADEDLKWTIIWKKSSQTRQIRMIAYLRQIFIETFEAYPGV
jgi:hypothetical protein